ncbi:cobalt-precorrin 5A hydrolase [Fusobacterium sp.]|uniref:cobalt-precorrin 5A hydrolase n=1 Tax=Fusobacterium sp. TaxID=68766 RepID=UPI0025BBAD24|nr:cobalt-precorrin 5A hydrolase [Fusobacterium sp.]
MRLAIWSVTRGAGNLAKKIGVKLEADIYTLKKFQLENTIQIENFTDELTKKFNNYDGHIFIMATGIVIRKISCLIKSKDVDPAVLVIDEGGNFVISLLSGHIGGANELTYKVANTFSLLPIITTSSDVTGKIAIDTLSQKLNCEMESLTKAKDLTSLIVDNKKVEILLPNNVKIGENTNSSGVVIASNKKNIDIMRIYPKNLIVGVGCRRGTPKEEIFKALDEVMKKHNLAYESIKRVATVDIKADELGLLSLVEELQKELVIISREEIKEVEQRFKGSEFVKKQIGVSCVSEPCALLASNGNGDFLEQKYIYNGITISIYEEKFGYE